MKEAKRKTIPYQKPLILKKKLSTNLYRSLGFQNSKILVDSQILLAGSGSIVDVCFSCNVA